MNENDGYTMFSKLWAVSGLLCSLCIGSEPPTVQGWVYGFDDDRIVASHGN